MAAQVQGFDGGILRLRVSGQLTEAELSAAQERAATLIRRAGTIRILVLVEEFTGWRPGEEWGDFSFQESEDAHIARMAIVGAPEWRDLAMLFTSNGLRPFPIEYFPAKNLAEAEAWLAAC
jgi:hypothetical protein